MRGRSRKVANIRQLAFWLADQFYYSHDDIADHFGLERTTVGYGVRKMAKAMADNPLAEKLKAMVQAEAQI